MQRPIRVSVILIHLCCFGCTGKIGCAGDNHRSTSEGPESSASGEILTPVDDDYDPCSDFASFACGTGGQLQGRLQAASGAVRCGKAAAVHQFLDRLRSGSVQDGRPTTRLLGELYGRCSDGNARDRGLRELRARVDEVSRIAALPELARALGVLGRSGIVRALVRLRQSAQTISPDEPYAARVALADPELPRKAYAGNSRLLAAHRKHWEALASFVDGLVPSEIEGALRVDRWLASAEEPESSDLTIDIQPLVARSRLERAAFPWREYLIGLGLSSAARIRPARPDSLALIDALARLPLADLRSYVKLLIVERSAVYIGMPVLEEEIRFHYEIVEEREHVALDLPNACEFILSRSYGLWIDDAFLASLPAAAEEPTRGLFDLLRDHFARTIAGATWLDISTRRTAAAKVSRIALRFVTDPDPGLEGAVLQPGSLLDAVWGIEMHKAAVYLAQIGRPRERRFDSQGDSGGAYSPFVNSVWLSTEYAREPWIQQRPFTAVNYGSLGTLMGHEIAHALSITSRPFDDAGFRRETWSKEAVAAFGARTACLEKQLRTTDVGAKWRVDAHRTLDEDLAELVGVQIALAALDAEASPADIQGRVARRRTFFLAYAQLWCGTYRGLALHQTIRESHSPPARILSGILANVPEFAETFQCAAGTRMAPRQRCAIW